METVQDSDTTEQKDCVFSVKVLNSTEKVVHVSGKYLDKTFKGILIAENSELLKTFERIDLLKNKSDKNSILSCIEDRLSSKGSENNTQFGRKFPFDLKSIPYPSHKTLRSRKYLCKNCKIIFHEENSMCTKKINNNSQNMDRKNETCSQDNEEISDVESTCSLPVKLNYPNKSKSSSIISTNKSDKSESSKPFVIVQDGKSTKNEDKLKIKIQNKKVKKDTSAKMGKKRGRPSQSKDGRTNEVDESDKTNFDSNLSENFVSVKDCEKPKNRWIKAERIRRSQESKTELPCYSSSLVETVLTKNSETSNDEFSFKRSSFSNENDEKAFKEDEHPISLKIRINRKSNSLTNVEDDDSLHSTIINSNYIVGDIVWSKLTGWPFWPAVITEIKMDCSGKPIATICWFAWNQVSYVECDKLIPFLKDYNSKYNKKRKGAAYHQAVKEALHAAKLKTEPNVEENFEEGCEKPRDIDLNNDPLDKQPKTNRIRRKQNDNFDPPKKKKRKNKQISSPEEKIYPTSITGELPSFSNPLEISDSEEERPPLTKKITIKTTFAPAPSVSVTPPIDVVNISSSTCDGNTPTYSSIHSNNKKVLTPREATPSPPASPRNNKIAVDIPTFSEAESEDDDLMNSDLNPGRLIIDQENNSDRRTKISCSVSSIVSSLVQNSITTSFSLRNNQPINNNFGPLTERDLKLLETPSQPFDRNIINNFIPDQFPNQMTNFSNNQSSNNSKNYYNYFPPSLGLQSPSLQQQNFISSSAQSADRIQKNSIETPLVHTAFGTYPRPHKASNPSTFLPSSSSASSTFYSHQPNQQNG